MSKPQATSISQVLTRRLAGLLATAGVIYGGACVGLIYGQNRLIFVPEKEITTTPANQQLPYTEVWIPVEDANQPQQPSRIHAWWLPNPKTQNVLLYLHGNGKNISANVPQAARLQRLGLSVLLIDYRGYGKSEGSFPTEASVYSDAQAAWNYLRQQRQIPANRIYLYGHSLGGAIAIDLAVQHPQAAGLIVQSSFTSMPAMTRTIGWARLFPSQIVHQRFDSLAKVSQLKLPVLYIHGTADHFIPDWMSGTLYANTPEPRQMLLVPGGGHNNVAEVGGEPYLQTIRNFIGAGALGNK
jgi:uncharacterized protein